MPKNIPKPKSSTQDHLDIEDIADDLVIFKTGWVGLVITVTALNFDLLSEAEQDATIYAYGAFLNSLTFPIQVLVRSRKADITSYFASLSEAEKAQPNPDLKRQIQKYEDFLQSIVHEKSVLDKKFYIIINHSPLSTSVKGVSRRDVASTKGKAKLLAEAKVSLYPRRDHIFKQMARVGLTSRQLATKELIELYYDIYNPAPTETQRVMLDTESYTTPMVKPAVEIPAPRPMAEPAGEADAASPQTAGVARSAVQEQTPRQAEAAPVFVQPTEPVQTESQSLPQVDSNLRPVPRPMAEPAGGADAAPLMPKGNIGQDAQSALDGLRQATAKAASSFAKATDDKQAFVADRPEGKS